MKRSGLVLAATFFSRVLGLQLPLVPFPSSTPLRQTLVADDLNWDKEPDVDTTGHLRFNAVSEITQLWAGTVIVQGASTPSPTCFQTKEHV